MTPTKKLQLKAKPPKGWFMSGANPDMYEASVDTSTPHSGTKCAHVRNGAKVTDCSTWATLMQQMSPNRYLGKRLRMTLWVRSQDLEGYAQPWLRIDGAKSDDSLAFDNMCKRYIKGTTEWTQYSIVLDVPQESTNIAFGLVVGGIGHTWMDDVTFEEVGSDVPTTDCPCSRNWGGVHEPENLNFEEDDE